jgi:hypothetical protein
MWLFFTPKAYSFDMECLAEEVVWDEFFRYVSTLSHYTTIPG